MIFIAHKILLRKKRIAFRVLIRKPARKNQLENPEIDGRIILNLI
jgi:hypothetical protein